MSDEYDVGYGKPPKHTQFKKGQSGNPRGRPKGSKNLKTDLEDELNEFIVIKESGVGKKVTKQKAAVKSLTAKAINGDTKALPFLLNMIVQLLPPQAADELDESLNSRMLLR